MGIEWFVSVALVCDINRTAQWWLARRKRKKEGGEEEKKGGKRSLKKRARSRVEAEVSIGN